MSEQAPTGITLMKMREEWTASLRAHIAELEGDKARLQLQLDAALALNEPLVKEVKEMHPRQLDLINRNVELASHVAELGAMLRECADDLASEIEGHYDGVKSHPVMLRKYERDMDTVVRARKILAKTAATNEHKVDG